MRFSTSDNYFAPSPQNPQRETAPVCPPRHGLFLSHKDTAYPPVQHRLNPKVSVILPTTETFLNTFLYPYYKENNNATSSTQSAAFTIYMPSLGRAYDKNLRSCKAGQRYHKTYLQLIYNNITAKKSLLPHRNGICSNMITDFYIRAFGHPTRVKKPQHLSPNDTF